MEECHLRLVMGVTIDPTWTGRTGHRALRAGMSPPLSEDSMLAAASRVYLSEAPRIVHIPAHLAARLVFPAPPEATWDGKIENASQSEVSQTATRSNKIEFVFIT